MSNYGFYPGTVVKGCNFFIGNDSDSAIEFKTYDYLFQNNDKTSDCKCCLNNVSGKCILGVKDGGNHGNSN